MSKRTLEFNIAGTVRMPLRKGEKPFEAAERAAAAIQKAIDDHAKRFDVNLDADYGELTVEQEEA